MGSMAKISVIIPVYNAEKYLRECLDSIVNQTLKSIEVICINDGSTDNSLNILNEYAQKDERIRIINQDHQGAGAARNNGLEAAKGEYLYFMDSDDYADIQMLEKLYNKINNMNADICVCKNIYRNMNSSHPKLKPQLFKSFYLIKIIKTIYYKNKIFNRKNSARTLFQLCNIPTYTKLYRKDFIKQNGIKFQEIKSCNDVFFNFYSLALAESVVLINESLLIHRCGHDSITKTRAKSVDCILLAFEELEKRLKEAGLFENLKETFYKRAKSCFKYELKQVQDEQEYRNWKTKFNQFLQTQEKDLISQRG